MLRCREVTELVGTDSLERAPLRTRLGVQIHLLMCRHCRAYVRSIRQIAATARQMAGETPAADSRVEDVLREVRRASAPGGRGTDDGP
jgi:predicted anti-sigma-YlaC factor YlaD